MRDEPSGEADQRRHRFISLRWRVLVLTSAALILVHAALLYASYRQLNAAFERDEAQRFSHAEQTFQRLLVQSATRLQRIGNIIPSVMQDEPLGERLGEQWLNLQLELGLDVLWLIHPDGQLEVEGMSGIALPLSADLRQRVETGLAEERPQEFLLCRPTCSQMLMTPSIRPDGQTQLMVLASPIADLILGYGSLSGSGLVLLLPGDEPGGAWGGLRMAAISDAPEYLSDLEALAGSTDLTAADGRRDHVVGRQSYRLSAVPAAEFGGIDAGTFVFFHRTTARRAAIRGELRRFLTSAVAGLAAALVLLMMILDSPLRGLKNLANALPMLARHAYGPARQLIGTRYWQRRTHTEIDVLESVTVHVSRQLEQMESTLASRNRALAEKLAELRRSQELNDKIFATAPVLLVIQTPEGEVRRINEFGSHLLGYGASEVIGSSFFEMLDSERDREQTANTLIDLAAGRRSGFEQTVPMRCVDGGRERVTWLHSRLAAESGLFVLSIGLPDRSQPDEDAEA